MSIGTMEQWKNILMAWRQSDMRYFRFKENGELFTKTEIEKVWYNVRELREDVPQTMEKIKINIKQRKDDVFELQKN